MPENPIVSAILSEAESGQATDRSLAVLWAFLMAAGDYVSETDWRIVGTAVLIALELHDEARAKAFEDLAYEIHNAAGVRLGLVLGATSGRVHDAPGAVQ